MAVMLKHVPTGHVYPFHAELAKRKDIVQIDHRGDEIIAPAPPEPEYKPKPAPKPKAAKVRKTAPPVESKAYIPPPKPVEVPKALDDMLASFGGMDE